MCGSLISFTVPVTCTSSSFKVPLGDSSLWKGVTFGGGSTISTSSSSSSSSSSSIVIYAATCGGGTCGGGTCGGLGPVKSITWSDFLVVLSLLGHGADEEQVDWFGDAAQMALVFGIWSLKSHSALRIKGTSVRLRLIEMRSRWLFNCINVKRSTASEVDGRCVQCEDAPLREFWGSMELLLESEGMQN